MNERHQVDYNLKSRFAITKLIYLPHLRVCFRIVGCFIVHPVITGFRWSILFWVADGYADSRMRRLRYSATGGVAIWHRPFVLPSSFTSPLPTQGESSGIVRDMTAF